MSIADYRGAFVNSLMIFEFIHPTASWKYSQSWGYHFLGVYSKFNRVSFSVTAFHSVNVLCAWGLAPTISDQDLDGRRRVGPILNDHI